MQVLTEGPTTPSPTSPFSPGSPGSPGSPLSPWQKDKRQDKVTDGCGNTRVKYLHSAGTHSCLFLFFFAPPPEEHQGLGTRGHGRSHLHLYYLFCLNSTLWIFYMCIGAFGERSIFNALLPTLFIYLVHTDIPLLQATCTWDPVGMLMYTGSTLNVTYRGSTYLPAT